MATEKTHGPEHKLPEGGPSVMRKFLGLVTIMGIGATLLTLGGLAVAAVITIVVVSTPFILFFSPILVPLGIVIFLGTAGLLGTGAAALATISVISWLYNYRKGRRPPGAEQAEAIQRFFAESAAAARERAAETAQATREKVGEGVQAAKKAPEAAPSVPSPGPQQPKAQEGQGRGRAPEGQGQQPRT